MSNQTVQCAFDDRRTGSETAWSFVASLVLCVGLWLHLQHSFVGSKSLWILIPQALLVLYSPSWLVILPVISIFLTAQLAFVNQDVEIIVINGEGQRLRSRYTTTRSLDFIMWSLVNGPTVLYVLYDTDRVGDWEIEINQDARKEWHIKLGHIALLLFGLIQSIGSIIRGTRRAFHGHAMIRADFDTLCLSAASLVVTIQLTILETRFRSSRVGILRQPQIFLSGMFLWLCFYFLPTLIVAATSLRHGDWFDLFSGDLFWIMRKEEGEGWSSTYTDDSVSFVPLVKFLLLSVAFLSIICALLFALERSCDWLEDYLTVRSVETALLSSIHEWLTLVRWIFAVILYLVAVATAKVATAVLIVGVIMSPIKLIGSLTNTFGRDWAVDQACPLLWKDPLWVPAI